MWNILRLEEQPRKTMFLSEKVCKLREMLFILILLTVIIFCKTCLESKAVITNLIFRSSLLRVAQQAGFTFVTCKYCSVTDILIGQQVFYLDD